MFFEIQSAKLEADDRPIDVAAPPSRNLSRRHAKTNLVGNTSTSVLDQIKRSAGNTPAFKSSERRSINTVNHHMQIHEYDAQTKHGDDLTSLYDAYEIDLIRPNDTDNGYAGFGVTPFATSAPSDFKLVSNYSLKTATTADESTYSLQNHTNEFTSFFFDHDAMDNRNDMENDLAAAESDKKSHVSTNSSRSMNYFTSSHNNTKQHIQKQGALPPPSSVASSSTKRFSPLKNVIGPAERMLRLLDGPTLPQQTELPTPPPIHQQSVTESGRHQDDHHHQSQFWYRDNENADDTDDEEAGPFGEPVSLLDLEENDDDDTYCNLGEGEDDYTYSDSYTQAFTNNTNGDDDGSYYDSEDYDDDETLLTMDDEYDEEYDDHDENGSKLPPEQMIVTGVESFLDELAEVEDVRDLGTLLYQVGSCNFPGITQMTANTAHNKSNKNSNDDYDDEYTVTSDAFPSMKQDIHMIHSINSNPTNEQQSHEPQHHPTPFTLRPQKPNDRSTLPQSSLSPLLPDHHPGSHSRLNPPSRQRFIEGTTDTVAQILHSMSISTESLYDILGSSSNLSQPSASSSLKHPVANNTNGTTAAAATAAATPNNANQSFFQSIFSCHG